MSRSAALERLQQRLDGEVKERFPEGSVRQVVLLQHGDDPAVEPGEVRVRVLIPKDYKAGNKDWAHENMTRIMEFRRELAERLPEVSGLEVIPDDPGDPGDPGVPYDRRPPRLYVGGGGWLRPGGGSELTAVMARLEPEDLQTLDALITAGVAANRSEAVRWALARIRERPAFAKLAEWVRGLDELKAEF
jgi:hypothetical protein